MSENTMNEIVLSADSATLANEITGLADGVQGFYSSFIGDDHETKLAILEAMTDSVPLNDVLGRTLMIQNIVVQEVEMEDQRTGELKAQPRVILVDAEGKAYHGISAPLFRDVKNWMGVMGKPHTWDAPLPVKVTRQGKSGQEYFKASITRAPAAKK